MRLPLTHLFMLEAAVQFHKIDEVSLPDIYTMAKSAVYNDKLIETTFEEH